MTKLKQFSNILVVLYPRDNSPWVGGPQDFTRDFGDVSRASEAAMCKRHDWLGQRFPRVARRSCFLGKGELAEAG